jgi:ribonuclease HI/exonuclease III
MVGKPLQVLQWNVGKRRESQLSLLNDKRTNEFDILLLQEPFRFTPTGQHYPIVLKHFYWEAILPTQFVATTYQPFNFRSMIYINKRLQAKQIPIDSADLTAVSITQGEDTIIVVSVYIERLSRAQENLQTLQDSLYKICRAIEQVRCHKPEAQIIIAGDFNRHNELWGGPTVNPSRQHEAEPILDMIGELQLWSALPQGTPTFRNWGSNHYTTIDLMLISSSLQPRIQACQTYSTDHGSDHTAIFLTLNYQISWKIPMQRRSYNMANWTEISETVQTALGPLPTIQSVNDLDQAASHLEKVVQDTLQGSLPIPTAFPYRKRWWTLELTELRRDYNFRRNLWTTATRRGDFDPSIRNAARRAKDTYHKKINQAKKTHWREFLEDNKNVWKALSYLTDSSKTSILPILQKNNTWYEEDQEKATVLLETFFPPQPEPLGLPQQQEQDTAPSTDPIRLPLSEDECRRAIFSSNPRKAPGPDDIPFRVWQELWPVVKHWVISIYRISLAQGHFPQPWTDARIVVIRKMGKPDYSLPKAYRPISLLKTIGKGLERIVAQRLSEYLERTGKLAATQFGARPRRSTDHALTILVEKIYSAWRSTRVLSLVTFDVQGAYNGVNKDVLKERLLAAGVPTRLVQWIYSFCSNRRACISFNGYQSNSKTISQPGLPQGSPLSPILYILFNSNLLVGKISRTEGDIGFVDDYTAWVVGPTAEENTVRIQTEIIPRVTRWETESGATFEAEKTQFIHFTRNRSLRQQPSTCLHINGKHIIPAAYCKILGVYLDQELRMKLQVNKAAQRALVQASALSSLRGLSSQAMRQLYLSTVASKLDYAAAVWFRPGITGITQTINSVQRIGARAITGGYRNASTTILELEAGLLPAGCRLQKRIMQYLINLNTLEDSHPWWDVKPWDHRQIKRFTSPLSKLTHHFHSVLQPESKTSFETIKAFTQAPAQRLDAVQVMIQPDRERAVLEAQTVGPAIFVDGSARNGVTGIGLAWKYENGVWVIPIGPEWTTTYEGDWRLCSQTMALLSDSNEYAAELMAILHAVQVLQFQLHSNKNIPNITILSDCQSAILSIQKPRYQSGQYLIREIWERLRAVKARGTEVILQWTPGHEGILGNELAHKAAKRATARGNLPENNNPVRLKSRALQVGRRFIQEQRIKEFKRGKIGQFTRTLDKALPQEHMVAIYNNLSSRDSRILVQLRTNSSPLNQHLKQSRITEAEECSCGSASESTAHFLFHCPNWAEPRKLLRDKLGTRWADLSYALGGWSGRFLPGTTSRFIDGPKEKWKPNIEVLRAVISFVKVTRRFEPNGVAEIGQNREELESSGSIFTQSGRG